MISNTDFTRLRKHLISKFIKTNEGGFQSEAYPDSKSIPTIGYGYNMKSHMDWYETITLEKI